MDVLLITGLLLAAAALRWLPITPTGAEEGWWPCEIGFLRGGPTGAVRTALAGLHSDGLIKIGGRNIVRRTDRLQPPGGDPVQRAVYGTMHTPAAPRALARRPVLRRALAQVAADLTRAGVRAARWRRLAGAGLVLTAIVVALVLDGGFVLVAGTVCAGAGLWALSRHTIAGHRVLSGARDAFVGLLVTRSTDADRAELVVAAFALGRERDLAAAGIPVAELSRITEPTWQQVGSDAGFQPAGGHELP
ncbi:TIGR04222 domain-containing membrane protein [Actinophytocola sp.]|uniref:TIGR04222 domain-containing membrane protein n=1 Tax=Actinophytocola sp. TaxID=1872138 RepID=UPI002D7F7009|nr:TIGR04222 domain-containing membrane protein [Actinophytocola sp.]HET9141491.1 TIGR04222 domain-containing membrane protein [Actinophytocola sp.]